MESGPTTSKTNISKGSHTSEDGLNYNISAWKNVNPLKFCYIKALISVVEESIKYPFILLKTHQQVTCRNEHTIFNNLVKPLNSLHHIESNVPSPHYTVAYGVYLYHSIGLKGLFRGYLWYALPSIPVNVFYFYSYNEAKHKLQHYYKQPAPIYDDHDNTNKSGFPLNKDNTKNISTDALIKSFFIAVGSGCIADALSLTLWVPFEVTSQHMQLQDIRPFPTQAPNLTLKSRSVIKFIYKHEGLIGFYRGYLLSLLVYSPASGIWWATYEMSRLIMDHFVIKAKSNKIKNQFSTNQHHNTSLIQNNLSIVISGALAGISACVISNPLDVIKTLHQTRIPTLQQSSKKLLFRYFHQIISKDGFQGFFKGLTPRLCTAVPSSALSFFIYEMVLATSQNRHH